MAEPAPTIPLTGDQLVALINGGGRSQAAPSAPDQWLDMKDPNGIVVAKLDPATGNTLAMTGGSPNVQTLDVDVPGTGKVTVQRDPKTNTWVQAQGVPIGRSTSTQQHGDFTSGGVRYVWDDNKAGGPGFVPSGVPTDEVDIQQKRADVYKTLSDVGISMDNMRLLVQKAGPEMKKDLAAAGLDEAP